MARFHSDDVLFVCLFVVFYCFVFVFLFFVVCFALLRFVCLFVYWFVFVVSVICNLFYLPEQSYMPQESMRDKQSLVTVASNTGRPVSGFVPPFETYDNKTIIIIMNWRQNDGGNDMWCCGVHVTNRLPASLQHWPACERKEILSKSENTTPALHSCLCLAGRSPFPRET